MLRSTIVTLVCSLLLAAGVAAQQPGDSTRAIHGPGMNRPRQMNRQMMMQKIQASDARLDQLVSQMNQSTGKKKIPAMAAVINELVAQRKQMHQFMGQMMDSGMMGRAGEGRQGMMQNPQPSGPDSGSMRPSAPDSGDHGEHHDTMR